ncbi:hypothetical protein CTAYLR_005471 [Chrysophaeum taylorii]|uniref:EF-hand domain-containing protein n=1 Tax=Chrysophaeum taylorii TaxID=2483200 RepID=A0AAD7XJA1_9STRA|nr:hypothetical protein CTAYLR_005471 [Chrysophaeum taylorii]
MTDDDVEKQKAVLVEEDDEWLAALFNPNKGDISNLATLVVFVLGLLLRFYESPAAGVILAFGLFGFAGGVTNWLAVKMLFDRIPLLVGSGVIPRRFKDILLALKLMILDTFFDEQFLREYIAERSGELFETLDLKGRLEKAMTADGFDATLARKLEVLAETPDGQLVATLAPMFGGIDSMVPMIKPTLVAVGVELLNSLADNFDVTDVLDVAYVRSEIDRALDQRMTTLTPRKVKRMMSRVIRSHLGWLVVWGNVFGGVIGILSWLQRGYNTMLLRRSVRLLSTHSDAAAAACAEKLWESPTKLPAIPLVYISGEEMTRYAASLMMKHWIEPHVDTSAWEFFDLSCKARDVSNDKVLHDAVAAGAQLKAIFKEPTITPTAQQMAEFKLTKALPSPNGAMRRGWNGVTISRDTIHIEGIELGFKKPVLFERHAVGGEYGAGWREISKGRLITTFFPDDENAEPLIVDARRLSDSRNVAVVYHNPLDNVETLADHFFRRCLDANVTPYVVTKKTVFKWQEPFWAIHKEVFDAKYRHQFQERGLVPDGQLQHLISDAATMQIIRWTRGNFGMAAHNYDGDMLTDEVAQVHRSPGFITSNLVGKADDGSLIKEFEASHGTVADLWRAHLRGEPTSFNPLGMAEAMMGAISHAAHLRAGAGGELEVKDAYDKFVQSLRKALHNTFRYGQGTWDMAGKDAGLTTEAFIHKVGWRLGRYLANELDVEAGLEVPDAIKKPSVMLRRNVANIDIGKVKAMFAEYDTDANGSISLPEFEEMVVKLGVAPLKQDAEVVATRTKVQEKTVKV